MPSTFNAKFTQLSWKIEYFYGFKGYFLCFSEKMAVFSLPTQYIGKMWQNETIPCSIYWKLCILWEFWARKAPKGSWGPQKKSKFQLHPRKKVSLWKGVFLQINLALATQNCKKWFLKLKKKTSFFRHFCQTRPRIIVSCDW